MKLLAGIGGKSAARLRRAPFRLWYALGSVVVLLAATGGLGYWYREQIGSDYTSTQDAVLGSLGLGVAPVAVWLAVFVWVLVTRRNWFRRVNLWAGSLVFVASILGVLSFFQPSGGVLGAITLDGDVSLGGGAGSAIVGPVAWQGALRLLAIFAVFLAIIAPHLMLDLAAGSGRLLIHAYVFSIMGVKGAASALTGVYRFDSRARFKEDEGAAGPATSSPGPSARLRADLGAMPADVSGPGVGAPGAGMPPALTGSRTAPKMLPGPNSSGEDAALEAESDEWEESPPPFESGPGDDAVEAPETAGARYNRFWGEAGDDVEGPKGLPATSELEGGDLGQDSDAEGPIVDPAGAMWKRPSIGLLANAQEGGISDEEMDETAEKIKRTLGEYGIEVEIGQVMPGPTVTMYGIIPGWIRRQKQVKATDEHGRPKLDESGKPIVTRVETKTRVKVDSIMSREKDLSLALKTPSIRIETPVMGESLVGIEVPNPSPNLVMMRGVMESDEFEELRGSAKLPIAIGKSSAGDVVVVDLADMPHLLIAGATGSGKSVCINTIVSGLILERTPAEMRLLLVDPKRVELTPYNGIPHLLTPVVVETDQVVALLKGLIREMLQRYRRMEEVGVRNISAYNKKMSERMPYLVVAVDELADLMMSASYDVEQSLCRLAQLGRATGIHLIVATQRPSVDVITGLIKANFPTRISFGVTSQIDSRTILDAVGAERLLGRGDMLYLAADASRPERVQGVFVSDEEIDGLVKFWQTTPWAPLPKVSLHRIGDAEVDDEEQADNNESESRDALLDNAVELAHRYNKLSTSLLQRRLRIGYPRAARLMDQLEEEGIVGPSDGSKSRDVIMSNT